MAQVNLDSRNTRIVEMVLPDVAAEEEEEEESALVRSVSRVPQKVDRYMLRVSSVHIITDVSLSMALSIVQRMSCSNSCKSSSPPGVAGSSPLSPLSLELPFGGPCS